MASIISFILGVISGMFFVVYLLTKGGETNDGSTEADE